MEYDDVRNELVFSTGTRVYANRGIIGISKDDYGIAVVHEGYDGGFEDRNLTQSERIELADYAIAMWVEYKGGSV